MELVCRENHSAEKFTFAAYMRFHGAIIAPPVSAMKRINPPWVSFCESKQDAIPPPYIFKCT